MYLELDLVTMGEGEASSRFTTATTHVGRWRRKIVVTIKQTNKAFLGQKDKYEIQIHKYSLHDTSTTHVGQWRGEIVARSGVKLDKVQKIKTQSDNHECSWPWPHTLELNNSNVGFIFGIWDTHLFLNPSYLFLNVVACMQDWKSMNMPSCFIKMPQRWPRKLNTD